MPMFYVYLKVALHLRELIMLNKMSLRELRPSIKLSDLDPSKQVRTTSIYRII